MKVDFSFIIPTYMHSKVFCAIRSKYDVIMLYSYVIEMILSIKPITTTRSTDQYIMSIVKQKKSRLCFFSPLKHFSIVFPFSVDITQENGATIVFKDINIDYNLSSSLREVITILKNENYNNFNSLKSIIDNLDNPNPNLYQVLHELAICEDGYLRYDYDQDRVDGDVHPLHHLDVFYSDNNSFKIGLRHFCSNEYFKKLLNIELGTPCIYFEHDEE